MKKTESGNAWAVLIAAGAMLSAAFSASAQDTTTETKSRLDTVIEKGELRICSTGDYKPFTYFDEQKSAFVGIDIDLAKSLAEALAVKPVFVRTSWSKLMPDFLEDKCDVAMGGISVNLARQKQAFFSEPYLVNGKAPIARCADVEKFKDLVGIDQPEVRVIVNPGGTNEKFIRENVKKAKIEVFPDNVKIFGEILAGKADIMVAESIEVKLQEKLNPGLCAINPDSPLQYGELGYLLPKGDVIFKAYIDQWLHLAKASGAFQKIYDQHVH